MGRPATGQKPVISFRLPEPLLQELDALAEAEERDRSDMLVEAVHDLIKKKRRERKRSAPDA